jgi:hypothetical protein
MLLKEVGRIRLALGPDGVQVVADLQNKDVSLISRSDPDNSTPEYGMMVIRVLPVPGIFEGGERWKIDI